MKNICTDYNGNKYFQCLESETFYSIEASLPGWSKFSELCENDPKFYQTCGAGHKEDLTHDDRTLCGYYICQENSGIFTSGYKADTSYSCNKESECVNTDLDESNCTQYSKTNLTRSKICDGYCDVIYCEDELECNGYRYGMNCGDHYCPPNLVGLEDHQDTASLAKNLTTLDAFKEIIETNLTNTCNHFLKPYTISEFIRSEDESPYPVPILNFTRCSSFKYTQSAIDKAFWLTQTYSPYCEDYLEQTNCSDPSKVGLSCRVNGYQATVSEQMLCHGIKDMKLCSDGIENVCVDLSSTCSNIHKHKMCDNTSDCYDKSDEQNIICSLLTEDTCRRRVGDKDLKIPLAWLKDGVKDCKDGEDELAEWPTCGMGETIRFVTNNNTKSCSDDFICLHGDTKYIGMDEFCDGVDTCGNENAVCELSRDKPDVHGMQATISSVDTVKISYCLEGLEKLENLASKCQSRNFDFPKGNVFGLFERTKLFLPESLFNCEYLHGELYIYMSCEGRCSNDAKCPLVKPVRHDSCPGQFPDRVYTVVDNDQLTFLINTKESYSSDVFVCENNRCVTFDKVCDLVDDCGDGSDEILCTNHFRCKDSKASLISMTQQCDGVYDCMDLSDECNERCGKNIIEDKILKGVSWAIGILAVILNCVVLIQSITTFKRCSTAMSLLNKLLIMLISLGDFLVGGYLLTISVVDHVKGDQYCQTQKAWLTSTSCSLLGVVSTVGSQFSLFSMTILSIARMYGIKNAMRLGGGLSKIGVLKNIVIILTVIIASLAIAMIPLHPSLGDYFVNGLSYDTNIPLFAGFPDKNKHKSVLKAYYGRMKDRDLSWKVLIDLMKSMFTSNYGGLTHTEVGFYGNDGVCLFKYFVGTDDPQKRYVWAILIINCVCFMVISLSYIVIAVTSTRSSKSLTKSKSNTMVRDRNRKMNRKVAVIIFTDFCCWIPFIGTCALHTIGVIDASPWYALFSILVLPINSVINPLLYDNTLTTKVSASVSRLSLPVSSGRLSGKSWATLTTLTTLKRVGKDEKEANDGYITSEEIPGPSNKPSDMEMARKACKNFQSITAESTRTPVKITEDVTAV